MRVLDLFSGIGGFSLGLERAGMETVAFCEYDKKAQLVLSKHWPDVPIFDDVRTLRWDATQDNKAQTYETSRWQELRDKEILLELNAEDKRLAWTMFLTGASMFIYKQVPSISRRDGGNV